VIKLLLMMKPLLHNPWSDTFPDQMPADSRCKISSSGMICTDEHGIYPGMIHQQSMPAWSRSVRSLLVHTRLIHGLARVSPKMNNIFLRCIDIQWLCTVRDSIPVQSVDVCANFYRWPWSGYTVTLVATRYLPVYTRNQHGWFSSGMIREKN
jgi:hypothetical protein